MVAIRGDTAITAVGGRRGHGRGRPGAGQRGVQGPLCCCQGT